MMPWLNSFAMMKVTKDQNVLKATDIESVGYFIQTRPFPPPELNDERFEEEFQKIKAQFIRVPVFTSDMEHETRLATTVFLDVVNRKELDPKPHLSLTTNGCYESSRTQGGRALAVCKGYIERFVRAIPTQSISSTTWWGAPFVEEKGIAPYRTMCRTSQLDKKFLFLQSSFQEETAPGGLLDIVMSQAGSEKPLSENYFGLDEAFPHQLLQWAIEECCYKGYLIGPPTKWSAAQQAKQQTFLRAPVRSKAHFQPEGGDKVRVLGCGPSCVTIALQPFAHWMAGIISKYPTLRSAFTRSFKGWDFSVSLMRGSWVPSEMDGLSVFDLEGASNGLNTPFMRCFGQKIIHNMATDPDQVFYLTQALELLLSPRVIEVRKDPRDKHFRVIHCVNGIHMGDPGTKEFLCTTSALMEIMVYGLQSNLPPAQVAGDDNVGIKSKVMHETIIRKHNEYGNSIVREKSQWSTIFVFYCEELIRWIPASVGIQRPPWDPSIDYDTMNIHLDIVKMRLLSPFSSVSFDQSQEKNPAAGKGDALWDSLLNLKNKAVAEFIKHTFFNWMSSYLYDDPMKFLPRSCGGNNVPYVGDRQELFERIMKTTGPFIAVIYRKLRYEDNPPPLFNVIISRMATGNVARGIIDPVSFILTAQFANLAFTQFQDSARTLDDLKEELQGKRTYDVSHKDALRYARQQGYLNYNDIVENLDRLTTMRLSLAAAAGAVDLDDILPSKANRLLSPSEVLRQFVDAELPHARRLYGADKDDFVVSAKDINAFRDWVLEGSPNFIHKARKYWIPQHAITDSLLGMKVDIPFRRVSSRVVPGSIQDSTRKRKNSASSGRVITQKRRKLNLPS